MKKPFTATVGKRCDKEIPCIHCHVADGQVYKIKDGRLKKGQGHYEALHKGCAEDFYNGKPSPSLVDQPRADLPLAPSPFRVIAEAPADAVCMHCHEAGHVKRVTDGRSPGFKSECLHEHCAQAWFDALV